MTIENDESRILTLHGEIKSENVNEIIEKILKFNEKDTIDDKKLKNFKPKLIQLYINSYGGRVYDGFGLIDIIKTSKTPVHTYCVARCMSMSTLIFINGHQRFCYQNSYFMIHDISYETYGKVEQLNEDIERVNELRERLKNNILNNTKLKRQTIENIFKKKQDLVLTSEQAKKLGLVDEIIGV